MEASLEKTEAKSGSSQKKKTPFFTSRPRIQKKLSVGAANDPLEAEADAMADMVVRRSMDTPAINANPGPLVQRKCAACEEEEIQRKPIEDTFSRIQKKGMGGAEAHTTSDAVANKIASSQGDGSSMDAKTLGFMESNFGADFSNVRIHTGSTAVQLSRELNAQAFTVGSDIYFNEGKYNPESTDGKHLLAHELTHTVQQGAVQRKMVQRAINCPSNSNGSPADAPGALQTVIDRAETIALGTSILLFVDSVTLSGDAFDAYLNRYGVPRKSGSKFVNRFTNAKFNDVDAAIESEMNSLSARFERVGRYIANTLSLRCPGTSRINLGDCRGACGANDFAWTCTTGTSWAVICPGFWNLGADARAGVLIHEVMHIIYNFGDRDNAPFANTNRRRGREPECYTSMAGDIYGFATGDPSCPGIPDVRIDYWRASGFLN